MSHTLRPVGTYPCYFCDTSASRLRGGVRVCGTHYRVMSLSNMAVLALAIAGAAGSFGWLGFAALHADFMAGLLAGSIGFGCFAVAVAAIAAWKDGYEG